ncbi:MAG: hypothetical protein ACK52A_18005, partial [Planctomycetota bacterium]
IENTSNEELLAPGLLDEDTLIDYSEMVFGRRARRSVFPEKGFGGHLRHGPANHRSTLAVMTE